MPASLQVDPSVSAIVHYVRSLYYKQQRDFAEFYMSSLLYLAFISMDSLPEDQKLVSSSAHGPVCHLISCISGVMTCADRQRKGRSAEHSHAL